ncbi:type II toxin-antitoxin system VapC family toxin [Candidatus Daviesbacteria bacterium]|nr:type II toxin-antitoxin system VapC family toxin [Candidatus Daviesbacteria bacterium]
MDKNILDASVVIKWFFLEEGSNRADLYLEKLRKREVVIIVPELLFYEVGNTLRSKKVQENDSDKIAKQLLGLPFEKKQMDTVYFKKIMHNVGTFDLTFYDAAYITLMQEEHCEFVTADRKLFETVHKTFTGIKLL